MFNRVGNFFNNLNENPDNFDLDAVATQGELNELLKQFQLDQAKVTREYQKLLTEKENELKRYKDACIRNNVEVAASVTLEQSQQELEGDTDEADARVSGALREKRLIERVKDLESQRDNFALKVAAHEKTLEALEKEMESNESDSMSKDKTIEDLVLEYSQLSGETRETSEKYLQQIAELEQDRSSLEKELHQYEDRMKQLSESAALVSQVTGRSGEEEIRQAQMLKESLEQVSQLNSIVSEKCSIIAKLENQLSSSSSSSSSQLPTPQMPPPGAQPSPSSMNDVEVEELRQEINSLKSELASHNINDKKSIAIEQDQQSTQEAIAKIHEEYSLKFKQSEIEFKTKLEKEYSRGAAEGKQQATQQEASSNEGEAKSLAKEFERLKSENDIEFKKWKDEYEKNKDKEMLVIQQEANKKLNQTQEESAQMMMLKETELIALKEEHVKAMEAIKTTEGTMSELKFNHESALVLANEEAQNKIKLLEEAHEKAIITAKAEVESKHAQLQNESENATVTRLNEALEVEKTNRETALAAQEELNQKQINELKSKIEAVEAEKENIRDEIKTAEGTMSELKSNHESALVLANEEAQNKIKLLEEAHEKAMAAATSDSESALKTVLEEAHQKKLEDLAGEHKEAIAVALAGAEMESAASLAMQSEKHENALIEAAAEKAALTEKHENALTEAAAEKAALTEKHENALTEAAAEYESKVAALTADYEDKLASCESKLDAANLKLTQLEAEFGEKLANELKEQELQLAEKHGQELKQVQEQAQEAINIAEKEKTEAYEQYLVENRKRKQVHNKLIELQGNIRVFARCRPMVEAELRSGKCEDVTQFPTPEDIVIDRGDMLSGKARFEFDACFKPDSEQIQVFEHVKPFVTSFLDGYNICIFAYGQTGSGKTFTMEGPPENRGVNLRSIAELFEISAQRSTEMNYTFTVSYLEIYNEAVYDLCGGASDKKKSGDRGKGLDIRGGETGISIPGLTSTVVTDVDQVVELMTRGAENRAVGSHDMNEHSSRSHSILTLTCEGTPVDKSNGLVAIKSKMHLIDLAGSERISKTDATGDRLKEAQAINKSLSALGDVIAALGGKKGTHVPYRNSKLTFLLQDSLSGNSKVLMFCNVSPASYNVGETLCTLGFAARCRNVELGQAKKGVDTAEVKKLKTIIGKLQDQIAESGGAEDKSAPSSSEKKTPVKKSSSSKTTPSKA